MSQRGSRSGVFTAASFGVSLAAAFVLLLQGCSSAGGGNAPPPPGPKTIAQIRVVGQPVKVFDHTKDQQETLNIPDAQITAWKEANGTVNLMIPSAENYRMRGPDLEHLTIDTQKIFSSVQNAQQIPENLYDYNLWMMGPYSLDGTHFYTLTHSEWYACLLNDDCSQTAANGEVAQTNSWTNTLNSLVSSDGGASWQLNIVDGNHVVAKTSFIWTGSEALAQKIYLQALNHTGMLQPTRIVKEGNFYYSIGYYIHRDFTQINPGAGVFEAPIDKAGYVLMRTDDVTNPNNWQAWTSGSTYEPITNMNFGVFLPQQNGVSLNAAPPQIIFDTNAQCFILIHTLFDGNQGVFFMTTKSLASPAWSDSMPIAGTDTVVSDPGGPVTGFNGANFVSILDDSSSGFNFEFTNGSPQLFFSTFPSSYGGDNFGRDVYRLQLAISYQ